MGDSPAKKDGIGHFSDCSKITHYVHLTEALRAFRKDYRFNGGSEMMLY